MEKQRSGRVCSISVVEEGDSPKHVSITKLEK